MNFKRKFRMLKLHVLKRLSDQLTARLSRICSLIQVLRTDLRTGNFFFQREIFQRLLSACQGSGQINVNHSKINESPIHRAIIAPHFPLTNSICQSMHTIKTKKIVFTQKSLFAIVSHSVAA